MHAALKLEQNIAQIQLNGHFTFEAHRDFKQVTQEALDNPSVTALTLDFAGVDYMDSAALGMLLLLNERAGGRRITLVNCKGTVKAVLDIANFGKIFDIK
ncbi:STAS domain-containing protein [Amantichitinum ursilacus]|uniref:STAS domain protein n=1 Tax=Amantichitinum ursilacus TaxID=857265 RepID=A0A0N0GPW5_9NEIS|nr:STAS domain-containing protein [Amantichitinum ursilacus]KPC54102.1 STAS domain protein [Amantichitinum ursilacus]